MGLKLGGWYFIAAVVLGLALLGPAGARAEPVRIGSIEIAEYGLFSGKFVGNHPADGTPSGINTVVDQKLEKQTRVIEARLGVRFGVKAILHGTPPGQEVTLKIVKRFPGGGMVNGKGERFHFSEISYQHVTGAWSISTWTFDHPYELVPGVWVFEWYYEGRKIGEKRFTVTMPR